MDLDSFRCFDAAATTLSFRGAAARVFLSPAAFSDRIRRLEEDLGVSLFRRTTRQVALTGDGQRLLPLVRETLAGIERVRVAAREKGRPAPFELVIGTRYELGLSWLCPALAPLARRRPERTIHLFNADSPDLLRRLERGDLDALVASVRLTSPRLAYAALHPEHYAFVSTTRCLRGRGDAEPWPFGRTEYLGGIANIRLRLLDGGGRVAVLPRYFIARDLAAGRLVTLLPGVRPRSDSFRLVWRAGHPREPELIALAAELRARPLR
jgi:LysR family glycine cleavage system transcriptional activator